MFVTSRKYALPGRGRLQGVAALAAFAALAAPAATALSGCGDSTAGAAPAARREGGRARLRDPAPLPTLHSGTVTLRVRNDGPDQHELIIVPRRSGVAAAARGRPDRGRGGASKPPSRARSSRASPAPCVTCTVQLKPGRYVLFCNMEGHYMAGHARRGGGRADGSRRRHPEALPGAGTLAASPRSSLTFLVTAAVGIVVDPDAVGDAPRTARRSIAGRGAPAHARRALPRANCCS